MMTRRDLLDPRTGLPHSVLIGHMFRLENGQRAFFWNALPVPLTSALPAASPASGER